MRNRLKLLLAILISLLPFSTVRVFFYNTFLGFKILKSKVGWLTILNVKDFAMYRGSIGSFNLFTGPFSVVMEEQNRIGSFNYIRCGAWVVNFNRSSKIHLKKEARISNQHYFDVFGEINIGQKTIIAGVRSQFWTHGGFSNDVNIDIGDNCYIGSGVKFAPSSGVSNNSVCGMGSVVTKKFEKESIVIAGVPAKIIKENINWREEWK